MLCVVCRSITNHGMNLQVIALIIRFTESKVDKLYAFISSRKSHLRRRGRSERPISVHGSFDSGRNGSLRRISNLKHNCAHHCTLRLGVILPLKPPFANSKSRADREILQLIAILVQIGHLNIKFGLCN